MIYDSYKLRKLRKNYSKDKDKTKNDIFNPDFSVIERKEIIDRKKEAEKLKKELKIKVEIEKLEKKKKKEEEKLKKRQEEIEKLKSFNKITPATEEEESTYQITQKEGIK